MQAFAALLDALSFQPARNAKLRLIETYLRQTPDPDRGWALAALTGELDFPAAKPALLRSFGEDKIGVELFHLSYDYVGDLAETLERASKSDTPAILKRWLDALDATGRWALLKLLTGALRVGVSARLAKQAVADLGDIGIAEIEEVWHAQRPPYEDLFAWLERRSAKPSPDAPARFRPVMLAQAIDEAVDFGKY